MSDFIWVEKYRPKTIEECILPESTKKTFQDFLDRGEIPNMLLAGPPGIGKTTVAKALCNELGLTFMSSMDPMKGDSWILSETMRKTSLRPYRLQQLLNTKSSSLMRQTTHPMMFNSYYGRLLRSLLGTAGSSLPVTTKIKS